MTITINDIKLFGSARMTDALDGGGPMSGQALQDGLENNVFPDIASTIDLARGALQLRAVYLAVLTATTDTLRQAHVVLHDLPDAAGVGALLIPGTATTRDVQSLTTMLNAQGDAYPFCGATLTTGAVSSGATVPVAGTRAVLVPKASTVSSVSGSMSAGNALPLVNALLPSNGSGGTVPARMPKRELRVPVVAGQFTYSITVPAGTLPGTEAVTWESADATITMRAFANDTLFHRSGLPQVNYAAIDRGTGQIALVFAIPPDASTELVISYAEGGSSQVLGAGDLAASSFDSSGRLQINLGSGWALGGAEFTVGGMLHRVFNGVVYVSGGISLTYGGVDVLLNTVVGTCNASGELFVPGRASQAVSGFAGAKVPTSYTVSSIRATLPANIDPATLQITGETSLGATFSATATALGVFSTAHVTGSYSRASGELVLTFASATKAGSLAYAGTQLAPQASFADLWGLNEAAFPADGRVRVVRTGQVGVLRHTATVAPATYTAGATVNLGRTDLADVRIVGANGLGISTGWTVDLATGLVSISSVSGWDQPAKIEHAIEHVAMVIGAPDEATVVLNRPVTRSFPSGSVLSTAVLLGDLQARVGATFSQQAWDSVWADTRTGPVISAQYQDALYPIQVTNQGAVTERWAFVFKSSTTYDLIGETLGRVASGDTASVFAPMNPAAGAPYMTVPPQGWGSWSPNNVLRINTIGAQGRVWAVRTVQPGSSVSGRDQALLAGRGDINV